ncbi:MraY family glycosyltransferase [Rhabdothermincola sp.]|uniref:MraY family glycosyltransferase n=1 Tax=Rhabdothermincola sp. TaxID=2820405 RepID=UPI002FE004F4
MVPAVLTLALTIGLTPLAIVLLRRIEAYDVPSERSSHVDRTLRGGGVAVAIAAVAGLVIGNSGDAGSLTTMLVAVSILAVVGLIDDLRTLEVFPRLGAQLIGAALCLPWFLNNVSLPWGLRMVLAVGTVVWMMGYVNAFNFMDGINGISGLAALVTGSTFVAVGLIEDLPLVSLAGGVLAAAGLGFLPYNFPRARVFLGDVGSYFLGGWIAFVVLMMLVSDVPAEAAFGPLVIYLADTTFTLGSRIARRERWWESHHEHVYQRLIERGWSHMRTASLVTAASATCAALGLVSLGPSLLARAVADATMGAVMLGYLALPALLARRAPGEQPALGSTRAVPHRPTPIEVDLHDRAIS